MTASDWTDEELVSQTLNGDQRAFNDLAKRWEGSLYRFALRTLGDPDEARDVCQDALVKAYENLPRLREASKFKSWAHHIVLNLCRDRYRKNRGTPVTLEDTNPLELIEGGRGPEAADLGADRNSRQALLAEIMSGLPEEQRTALLLREYHGLNSKEIAEITGVPAATVRTRIFYGLKGVRKAVQQRGLQMEDLQ